MGMRRREKGEKREAISVEEERKGVEREAWGFSERKRESDVEGEDENETNL